MRDGQIKASGHFSILKRHEEFIKYSKQEKKVAESDKKNPEEKHDEPVTSETAEL